MTATKRGWPILSVLFLAIAIAAVHWAGGIDFDALQNGLQRTGFWAPLLYMAAYAIATCLLVPSTPLNLAGGALFGLGFGTLWTSGGAIAAALIAFGFSRSLGRVWMARWLNGTWQRVDEELSRGGLAYTIALRLQPILPYGLVNFAAGLTAIRFWQYCLGTVLGTVPGVLPFVWLGDAGLKALSAGSLLPLALPLGLLSLAVGGVTSWQHFRQRRADLNNFKN